jgi:four helix bundle protein
MMSKLAQSYRDLEVYKDAFRLQQHIFQISKGWPAEERYALTDQVRRSSRSIGANIAEAWAKRRYPAHFLSKLTDSDGELQETLHWLDSAVACGYVADTEHKALACMAETVGKQLGSMINRHESFCTAH